MKGRYGVNKYILIAFAVMAAAYWYLSGGSSFEPALRAESDRLTTRILPLEETMLAVEQPATQEIIEIAPAPTPAPEALPAQDDSGPKAPLPQSFTETFGVPAETAAEAPIVLDPVSTAPQDSPRDLRIVNGDSVNLRSGPGRTFEVVSKLTRGTEVSVLDTDSSGWQQVRVGTDGTTGWMSGEFLSFAP